MKLPILKFPIGCPIKDECDLQLPGRHREGSNSPFRLAGVFYSFVIGSMSNLVLPSQTNWELIDRRTTIIPVLIGISFAQHFDKRLDQYQKVELEAPVVYVPEVQPYSG